MTLRTGLERHGRKNPLPFPFFEAVAALRLSPRLTNKGKVGVQRGRETAGVPSFLPPRRVPRRSRRPQTANPPAEVQRKTFRPLGANTLTQFEYPAQPVLKRSRPSGTNTLAQFAHPAQPVQEIYTKRAAAPMQQLFSMQNLNRTGSKPKFPRRYARSPR